MRERHICVVGLGYIGLPTAVVLAKHDFLVTGVDKDEKKLEKLSQGQSTIAEVGLGELLTKAIEEGTLKFSIQPQEADVYIICVPTPINNDPKASSKSLPSPDMTYVDEAVAAVAKVAPEGALIILESTSPVGSTEKISKKFEELGRNADSFDFAYCPERVLPGNIIRELEDNDRIVGGLSEKATSRARIFYQSFVCGEVWSCESVLAELCKLVENSYRDVNIAFANELSIICDKLGLDVDELTRLANRHPRVSILKAGIGVGGHCIAVDPYFIVSDFPEQSVLMQTARQVNLFKTNWVFERIRSEALNWQLKHAKSPKIAFLGLSYKPNVADLRESPAYDIACAIAKEFTDCVCVEPHIKTAEHLNLTSFSEALTNSDLIVALVNHDEFRSLNKQKLDKGTILDFCGCMASC